MKEQVYSGLSDEQVVGELMKGDPECFGILYSRYYSKVYARCYSFSRNSDDAFDMTQEILVKAISKVGSFEGNSKFSTWLYSITNNYCITQISKKNREHREDLKAAYQIPEEKTEEDDFLEREKWEALETCLDEYLGLLTEEESQMLILKYRMNYSIKELQKRYDLSASAVKMRLLRARLKINQLISLKEAA